VIWVCYWFEVKFMVESNPVLGVVVDVVSKEMLLPALSLSHFLQATEPREVRSRVIRASPDDPQ
jgi:hypothetical protein